MGLIILNGEQYGSFEETGFPPLFYSDEEREVGVWIDGKPLYQKTIDCGLLPKDTDWHSVPHGITNIERMVSAEGILFNVLNNAEEIPAPCSRPNRNPSAGVIFERTGSNINYMNNWQDPSQVRLYVTMRYTKTTDVPGSGKYTTYGGLTHHYSYNEQIIGTLADGSTLYEKTYAIPCNFNTTGAIDIIQLTNEKPIHYEGYAIRSTNGRIYPLPFSNGYATTNFRYNEETNSIALILANDSWGDGYTFYLTVQYYKSNS